MSESSIDGHLNLEGSTVVFHGAPGDCAEFALEYRAIFPQGQPFLLFDEGYNRSIELRPETTGEDIVSALQDTTAT
ncbi:hypothetical protein [Archangium violaceum]|uniref:Uncharacterized protein n=1 Tax=Archangium violaceum Cb vi76 TaxID=1406225 RepID=A0A084SQ25_9BACT|nr:hypothetical protein [Archangium violaceum]KFA90560.1 hypothetical protein Q664_27225 [Archangium violaceum Cb vi76]